MVVLGTYLPSVQYIYALQYITLTISLCNCNIDYLGIPQAGLLSAIASLPRAFSSDAIIQTKLSSMQVMVMEVSGKFCCLQVLHVNLEHL